MMHGFGTTDALWRYARGLSLSYASLIRAVRRVALSLSSCAIVSSLSGCHSDPSGNVYDVSRGVPKGRGKIRSNAAIISTRRVRETVPDLEGAKTGS